MKTLIVGAGVIGTIYGWALSEAGVDVTHLVREGKSRRFEEGVTLDVLDERKGHPKKQITHYALKCVETISPADGYELIIVSTSVYQVEEAVRTLAPLSGDALFLIFSANWEGLTAIDALLPRERYLVGYPDGGGTLREGLLYWVNIGAEPHLGRLEGMSEEALQRVQALFEGADMQPDLQDNILHWLWLHNAMNVAFWAGFAKYKDMAVYLKDRALIVECFRATQEVVELCRLRGVAPEKYSEAAGMSWPAWLFVIFFRSLYRFNESMQRYTAHAATSLPEARVNFEAVLKTASEYHLAMPHMAALAPYLESS